MADPPKSKSPPYRTPWLLRESHFLSSYISSSHYLPILCFRTCFLCRFSCIISIIFSFPFIFKKNTWSHTILQPFKNRYPPRGYKHFVHFQMKFIEKFQAGESGIVLKPLNARLSTCILKNEQKKRTKKREKIKQSGEFKMVVFSQ